MTRETRRKETKGIMQHESGKDAPRKLDSASLLAMAKMRAAAKKSDASNAATPASIKKEDKVEAPRSHSYSVEESVSKMPILRSDLQQNNSSSLSAAAILAKAKDRAQAKSSLSPSVVPPSQEELAKSLTSSYLHETPVRAPEKTSFAPTTSSSPPKKPTLSRAQELLQAAKARNQANTSHVASPSMSSVDETSSDASLAQPPSRSSAIPTAVTRAQELIQAAKARTAGTATLLAAKKAVPPQDSPSVASPPSPPPPETLPTEAPVAPPRPPSPAQEIQSNDASHPPPIIEFLASVDSSTVPNSDVLANSSHTRIQKIILDIFDGPCTLSDNFPQSIPSRALSRDDSEEIANVMAELNYSVTHRILDTTENAMERIISLCTDNAAAQKACGDAGMCQLVSSLLLGWVSQPSLLESILMALAVLVRCGPPRSGTNLKNLKIVLDFNIIDLLLACMKQFIMEANVCGAVALVISRIAHNSEYNISLPCSEVVESLLHVLKLHSHVPEVAERCIGAIMCFSREEACVPIFLRANAGHMLLNLMQKYSLTSDSGAVVAFTCAAVGGLAVNGALMSAMLDAKPCEMILNVLRVWKKSALIVEHALYALSRFATHELLRAKLRLDESFISVMLQCSSLHQESNRVVCAFASTICILSSSHGLFCLLEEIIDWLSAALYQTTKSVIDAAICGCVCNIVTMHKSVLSQFVSARFCDFVASVLQWSIEACDRRVIAAASFSIHTICCIDARTADALFSLNCVELLGEAYVLRFEEPSYYKYVVLAISAMCIPSPFCSSHEEIIKEFVRLQTDDAIKETMKTNMSAIAKDHLLLLRYAEVVESSFVALGNICSVAEGQTSLARDGCHLAIATMKLFHQDPDVLSAVFYFAASLALLENNAIILVSERIEKGIMKIFDQSIASPNTCEMGILVLYRLLRAETLSADFLVDNQAIQLLLKILTSHVSVVATVMRCCDLLRELVHQHPASATEDDVNLMIAILVECMKQNSFNANMISSACSCFCELGDVCSRHFQGMFDAGVCEIMASCLQRKDLSYDACKSMFALLWRLAKWVPEAKVQLGVLGVGLQAVNFLRSTIDDAIMMEKICLTLLHLCEDNSLNASRCVDADVCSVTVIALQKCHLNREGKCVTAAAGAICRVITGSPKTQSTYGLIGAVEALSLCLFANWGSADIAAKVALLECATLLCQCNEQDSGNEKNIHQIISFNVPKAVISAMQKHSTSCDIISHGCRAISAMCLIAEGFERLWKERAIDYIISGLRDLGSNDKVVFNALLAVGRMCQSERSILHLAELKLVEIIERVLKAKMSSSQICVSCCRVIVQFLCGSWTSTITLQKQAMRKYEIFSLLIRLLQIHKSSDDVFYWACDAITCLCDNNAENAFAFASLGVGELLTAGFRCLESIPSLCNGCLLVETIACSDDIVVKLSRSGVSDAIIGVLRKYPDNATLAQKACLAVKALAENEMACSDLGSMGACELMVTILGKFMSVTTVADAASSAITALSTSSRENAIRLGGEDTVSQVIASLHVALDTQDRSLCSTSCTTVFNLVSGNVSNQVGFASSGCCELLVRLLGGWKKTSFTDYQILRAMVALSTHGTDALAPHTPNVNRLIKMNAHFAIFDILKLHFDDERVVGSGLRMLCLILTTDNRVIEQLDVMVIGDLLISAMKKYVTTSEIACPACQLVSLGIPSPTLCAILLEHDIMQTLIGAFRLHAQAANFDAVSCACNALSTLLEFGGSDTAYVIESSDFPTMVMSMLDRQKMSSSFASIGTLTITRLLCYCDKRTILDIIRKSGGCENLVGILEIHSSSTEVAYNAVEAVYNACLNSTDNQTRFGRCGACEAITTLLRQHMTDASFVKIACTCVGALCSKNSEIKGRFGQMGMCPVIMNVMRQFDASVDIVSVACLALRNLTGNHTENIHRVNDAGTGKYISGIFMNHINDRDAIMHISAVLSNLLIDNGTFRDEIGKSGVCEAVVTGLQAYADDAVCLLGFICLVTNISAGHCENAALFSHRNVCDILKSVLHKNSSNMDILDAVCAAMASLCVSDDAQRRFTELAFLQEIVLVVKNYEKLTLPCGISFCDAIAAYINPTCRHNLNDLQLVSKILQLFGEYGGDNGEVVMACSQAIMKMFSCDALQREILQTETLTIFSSSLRLYSDDALPFHSLLSCTIMIQSVKKHCFDLRMITAFVDFLAQKYHDAESAALLLRLLIECLNEDNIHHVRSNGIVENLVMIIKYHKENIKVMEPCIRLVVPFVSTDDISAFSSCGICDIAASFIKSDLSNEIFLTSLCFLVGRLCLAGDVCAVKFLELGVPSAVVKLLAMYKGTCKLCRAICVGIRGLATHRDNVSIMFDESLPQVLCSALEFLTHDPKTAAEQLSCVRAIVTFNSEYITKLVEVGCCDAVIRMLGVHVTDALVVGCACDSISTLLNHSVARAAFAEVESIYSTFTECLKIHIEEYDAIFLLVVCIANMFKFVRPSTEQAYDLYQQLIIVFHSWVGDARLATVMYRAVANMAYLSKNSIDDVSAVGVCNVVMLAMMKHASNGEVQFAAAKAIQQLTAEVNQLSSVIAQLDGCHALVAALDNHSSDDAVVGEVCGAIVSVSNSSVDISAQFSSSQACEILLELLDSEDVSAETIVSICLALQAIGVVAVNKNRLARLGAKEIIHKVMERRGSNCEVLAAGLGFIAVMSGAEDENTPCTVDLRGCEMLISALRDQMHVGNLVMQACRGIEAIACDFAESVDLLGSVGACELLVQALNIHASSAAVVDRICLAIGSLAVSCASNVDKFERANVVPAFLDVFDKYSNDGGVIRSICFAMQRMAVSTSVAVKLETAECCERLLDVVKNFTRTNAEICSMALLALRQLVLKIDSSSVQSRVFRVLKQDGSLIVFEALKAHKHVVDCTTAALWMMRILSLEMDGRNDFGQLEAMQFVVELLLEKLSNIDIVKQCHWVIHNMMLFRHDANIEQFLRADGCSAAIRCANTHSSDKDVVERCCWHVYNCIISHLDTIREHKMDTCTFLLQSLVDHGDARSELAEAACGGLASLCDPQCVSIMVSKNIHRLLNVVISSHMECASCLEQAFTLILNILSVNVEERKSFVDDGICGPMLSAAIKHVRLPGIAALSCKTVALMSAGSSDIAAILDSHEATGVIVGAIQWNPRSDDVSLSALSALIAMATDNAHVKESFGLAGACESVVQVLMQFPSSAIIMEMAMNTIWVLCVDCADNSDRFANTTVCKEISKVIDAFKPNADVVKHCCAAAWHLSLNNIAIKSSFKTTGIIDKIDAVLKLHMNDEEVAGYACSAIWSLSGAQDEDSNVINAVRTIIDTINAHVSKPEMVQVSCTALSGMAGSRRKIASIGLVGGCEALISALRAHVCHADVVTSLCDVLCVIAIDDDNLTKLVQGGVYVALLKAATECLTMDTPIASIFRALDNLIKTSEHVDQLIDMQIAQQCVKTLKVLTASAAVHSAIYDVCSRILSLAKSCANTLGAIGICELVVSSLNVFNDVDVARSALIVGDMLCIEPKNRTLLLVSGIIDATVKVLQLHRSNANVMIVVSQILQTITDDVYVQYSQHQNAFYDLGVLEMLISAGKEYLDNSSVLLQVLTAIIYISKRNIACIATLVGNDVASLTNLVLLRYASHDVSIAKAACSIIVLCCTDVATRETFGKVGVCDPVVAALKHACETHDVTALRTISYAIVGLIRGSSGNQNAIGQHEDVFSLIVSMLAGWMRNMEAEEAALWVVALLCRHDKNYSTVCLRNIGMFRAVGAHDVVIAQLRHRGSFASLAEAGCWSLCGLASDEEYTVRLGGFGACEVAISILKSHADERPVVEAACSVLASLAVAETNREKYISTDVAQLLVNSLNTYLDEIPVSSVVCRAIQFLCLGVEFRNKFTDMGASEVISSLAHKEITSHFMIIDILGAIKNLSMDSEVNKSIFGQHSIIELLLDKLRHEIDIGDEDLILAICEAVKDVTDASVLNAATVGSCGGCELLNEVLQKYSNNTAISITICTTVRNLTLLNEYNASVFNRLDTSSMVVNILSRHEGDANVSKAGSLALQVIGSNNSARAEMNRQSTCQAIINSLRNHMNNASTTEQNCATIAKLVQADVRHRDVFVEMSVYELVATAVRKHMREASVMHQVMRAIEQLCKDFPSAASTLGSLNVCDSAVMLLRRHASNNELIEQTLRAIFELSMDDENVVQFGISGACECIANILSTAVTNSRRNAIIPASGCIMRLAKQTPSHQESIGLAGACKSLMTSLHVFSEDIEVIGACLGAVGALCRCGIGRGSTNAFNTNAFYELRADEVVTDVLQKYGYVEVIAMNGSFALTNLCRDDIIRDRVCRLGACEVLPAIIKKHGQANDHVAVCAIAAIGELSLNPTHAASLCENHALDMVVFTLKDIGLTNPEAADACCRALRCLALEDNVGILRSMGICETLSHICKELFVSSTDVIYSACGAIARITRLDKTLAVKFDAVLFLNSSMLHESNEYVISAIVDCLAALTSDAFFACQYFQHDSSDFLVRLLRRYIQSSSIVSSICNTLSNIIASCADCISLFVGGGICDSLMGAMRRHMENADILIHITRAVSVLALDDDASMLLGGAGACECLINSMKIFPDHQYVLQSASKAARNLACNFENKLILVSVGAAEIALVCLRKFSQVAKNVLESCGLLVNLFEGLPDADTRVVLNACYDIFMALSNHVADAPIVEQICRLLKVLAVDEVSRDKLGEVGICHVLPDVLEQHAEDVAVVEKVLGAISRVAFKNNQNKALFNQTRVHRIMVRTVEPLAHLASVVEYGCLAVTALSAGHPESARLFGEFGWCELLCSILESYSDDSRICAVACQTIPPLCKIGENLHVLCSGGCSQYLCGIFRLHISNPNVVKHVSGAIASVSKRSEEISVLHDSGVCTLLCEALVAHTVSADISRAICTAVSTVSKNEQCALKLGEIGICNAVMYTAYTHQSDKEAFAHAIATAYDVAMYGPNAHKLATSVSMDRLVAGMQYHIDTISIMILCCKFISRVVVSREARDLANASGVCEAVARGLKTYKNDGPAVIATSRAVAALCTEHDDNAERCAKSSVCLLVLKGLETHMLHVEATAALLAAVRALSSSVVNRHFFGSGDGCELMKYIMLKNIDHPQVCQYACEAVGAIAATSEANKNAYSIITICDTILKILRTHMEFDAVVVGCCSALVTLVKDHPDNAQVASTTATADLFIGIIKHHGNNTRAIASTARVISTLLEDNVTYATTLKNMNARAQFVVALGSHDNDFDCTFELSRLLHLLYRAVEGIEPMKGEVEIVTRALSHHTTHSKVAIELSGIIATLCRSRNATCLEEFGDLGVCDLIVKILSLALDDRNVSIAMAVMAAVLYLCFGSAANQHRFGQNNACSIVVTILQKMIHWTGYSSIAEVIGIKAASSLIRYGTERSTANNDNIAQLTSEGICEYIVSAAQRSLSDAKICKATCIAIMYLASDNECCIRLSRVGAAAVLVKIIEQHAKHPKISQYACGAIANMSTNNDSVNQLNSSGAAVAIVNALNIGHENSHLVLYVLSAIQNMCIATEASRSFFGSTNISNVMMELIKTYETDEKLLSKAYSAISSLVILNAGNSEQFLRLDILSALRLSIEKNFFNELLLCTILRCIFNFCELPFNRAQFLDAGFLRLISKVTSMHLSNARLVRAASKSLVMLLDYSGLDKNTLYEFKDAELCDNVVKALKKFASDDKTSDELTRLIVALGNNNSYNRDKLLAAGAPQVVMQLLSHNLDNIVLAKRACHVMKFMASDGTTREVLRQSGVNEKLADMLRIFQNDTELVQLCCTVISMLSMDSVAFQDILCEEGVCDSITNALTLHGENKTSGYELCMVMHTLCRGSDNCLKALSRQSNCVAAVSYVQRHGSSIKYAIGGIRAISALALSSTNRNTIGKCGGCEAVCANFSEFIGDADYVNAVCNAIYQLSVENSVNTECMCTKHVCKCISAALEAHRKSNDTVVALFMAMSLLAPLPTARHYFGRVNVAATIVDALMKHWVNEDVLRFSLQALTHLSVDDANKTSLGSHGMCEMLIDVMHNNYEKADIAETICRVLSNLCTDDVDNMLAMEKADVISGLVEVLETHGGLKTVACEACIVVKHLAEYPSGPHAKIGRSSLCQKVVLALATHLESNGANFSICNTIRTLAGDENNRAILGGAGVCDLLVKLLKLSVEVGDSPLLEECLATISALVRHNSSNQENMGTSEVCDILVELIGAGNGLSIEEKAIWCIANLCRNASDRNTTNEKNTAKLGSNGAIQEILTTMRENMNAAPIITAGAWALRNLSFLETNTNLMLSIRCFDTLSSLLRHHLANEVVCEALCSLLSSLFCVERDIDVLSCGLCELVIQTLHRHPTNASVVERCCSCIASLSWKRSEYKYHLAADGGCASIVRGLKFHKESSRVAQEACGAIWNIALDNSNYKTEFGAAGACEVIVDVLTIHKKNPKIVDVASGAISSLIENHPENGRVVSRLISRNEEKS